MPVCDGQTDRQTDWHSELLYQYCTVHSCIVHYLCTIEMIFFTISVRQSCSNLSVGLTFLQRAQLHCKRCISYGNSVRLSVCPSVCLSVRLSHASIVSKRRHVARCSLHCQIAKCVYSFEETKNIPQGRPLPPEILAQTDLPSPDSSESWHVCLVAPQW